MKYDKVLDSGKRQEFKSGSVRDTQEGKGRPELIPPWGLLRLSRHYENGAKKYGDHNWTKGQPISRYLASMFRHLIKYMGGCRDEDHLAAIAWNAMSIIDHEERISRGLLEKEFNDIEDWPKSFIAGEFSPSTQTATLTTTDNPEPIMITLPCAKSEWSERGWVMKKETE